MATAPSVGSVYAQNGFEYKVVATFPHVNCENTIMCATMVREIGRRDVRYVVFEAHWILSMIFVRNEGESA